MELYDLKVLHRRKPIIDEMPYFSWKIASNRENVLQEAYRIVVRRGEYVLWDSGKVFSREQAFIPYQGEAFASCTCYSWEVSVWDNYGEPARAKSSFATAFLEESDWHADWIECSFTREAANEYKFGNAYPPVLFEKEFSLDSGIKQAVLYATAHGVYRPKINDERLDDREFAPEYTPYDSLLYYQTYDVTELLREGSNDLSFYVGDGWYFSAQAQPVMEEEKRHSEPSVLFQLQIEYQDGRKERICSDGGETCRLAEIVYSDLYQGEKQDFSVKEEQTRYPVCVKGYGYDFLRAQPMEPIRPMECIPAVELFMSPAGEMIVDFGQMIAGRARIALHDMSPGQEAVFEYFEILDADGNYINTMFAPQKDTVISDGKDRLYEAAFTFHGFRYLRVMGMKQAKKEDFTAVLLTTEKENAGSFACSDERLNRLYRNVRYSQYNNMMSVPTDCPTREKAGWTGDILVYARTALLNEDVTPFLSCWLRSVRENQAEDGAVMITSPYMQLYVAPLMAAMKKFGDDRPTGVAGWSDAVVWVPYEMYRVTGNRQILMENYDAMERWCGYIITTAEEKRGYHNIPLEYDRYLWNTGFHFGEWLVPSRPDNTGEQYGICKESAFYIAPFFGYMTMVKMAEICEALEKKEQGAYYRKMAEKMRCAIQKGILYPGLLPDYLMGAYALAFAFDLVPEDLRDEYHQTLVNLIHDHDDCLDTGFLATPFLLDALCDLGEEELAYRILWQDRRPSWLYEVDHGATAIWEAWDADDAARAPRFVSFDHYAFGCVDDFICRRIAGIDSDTAGYSHLVIAPKDAGRLTWCRRTFESEAGIVSVAWDQEKLTLEIPPNCTATVLWKGKTTELGSGTYQL